MKFIRKRILAIVCVLALTLSMFAIGAGAAPATSAYQKDAAQKLFTLGLFKGTSSDSANPQFELDRTPTRAEALVMLARLLGKDAEALETAYGSTPFTDVPNWAKPYVAWAYKNSYTYGVSEDKFGSDLPVTAAQYLTFVLRALGYAEGADYDYEEAWLKTDAIGITHGEYNSETDTFLRGDAAYVSFAALSAATAGGAKLIDVLIDAKAVTLQAAIAVGLKTDTSPAPQNTPSNSGSGGGGGGGGGTSVPAAPALAGQYTVDGVNYALLNVPKGSTGYTYKLGGSAVTASAVRTNSDGSSLYKAEIPAGTSSGTLTAVYGGKEKTSYNVSFNDAGIAAPKTLYGVVPMKFSEFFYDVTGSNVPAAPDSTVFAYNGTSSAPELFIAQGTRTGNNGSITYAAGKELPKVDAISSATFGDASVHFVPDANLTNNGDRTAPASDFAMTGIANVEVGINFDLYANAKLLDEVNQATVQSEKVLSALDEFTLISKVTAQGAAIDPTGAEVDDLGVYRVKYLLIDGNWGKRIAPTDGTASTPKPLPGDDAASAEAEGVTYGGNWGDKMTGYVIDNLEQEYAGNNYWTNFANYFYGGYITDENGHTEPLVFLQNLFTHMAHTDFDIAVSPSRFDRFENLAPYGTYQVKVLAWGFRDIDFEIELKDFVNGSAALQGGASIQVNSVDNEIELTITGVSRYDENTAVLKKGADVVDGGDYRINYNNGEVTLTLEQSLFEGNYQGAYTLTLVADTDTVASKQITFTLINPVRPLLTTDESLENGADGTQSSKLEVSKSDGKLYFDNEAFAVSLVTAGRSVSTVKNSGNTTISNAFKRGGAGELYYIDLSILDEGDYVITAISTGFNTQTYYITVTA